MTRFITPTDEAHWLSLRTEVATSTEVAALFNQSPYLTAFELWHRKAGRLDSNFQETERTRWGNRLEEAIALGVAEDEGWTVRRMPEFAILDDLRAGSSFDYAILENAEVGAPIRALLEIKNVDHWVAKDGWIVERNDDGTFYIEAPVHIELQMQHQMMCSGIPLVEGRALVGGNRVLPLTRTPDPVIQDAIREAVTEFWRSIDAGEEPTPDFERDADVIHRLYSHAADGKVVEASEHVTELALRHADLGKQMKELETKRDAIKAEILTEIGDAAKVTGEWGSITAGMVAETEVAYTRKSYRNFRVNPKKQKAKEPSDG